jgi:hypothetical protein
MSLIKEISRIKDLMVINERKESLNMFKDFNINDFKKFPNPTDDSSKTKEEINFLKKINLNKRFVQEKDDVPGNFITLLEKNNIDKKKLINKVTKDAVNVILELKKYYKRPRPFRLEPKLRDTFLESMDGFAYPSGHSTQSYLLYFILSDLYPHLKKDLLKTAEDIVFSRQMAKAHYPSDIEFGKKLAKSMFNYLKDNDLIQ